MKTITFKTFNPLHILSSDTEWNDLVKENPWGFIIQLPKGSYLASPNKTFKYSIQIGNWYISKYEE